MPRVGDGAGRTFQFITTRLVAFAHLIIAPKESGAWGELVKAVQWQTSYLGECPKSRASYFCPLDKLQAGRSVSALPRKEEGVSTSVLPMARPQQPALQSHLCSAPGWQHQAPVRALSELAGPGGLESPAGAVSIRMDSAGATPD